MDSVAATGGAGCPGERVMKRGATGGVNAPQRISHIQATTINASTAVIRSPAQIRGFTSSSATLSR